MPLAKAPSTSQSEISYSMKQGNVSQSRGSASQIKIKMCEVSMLRFPDLVAEFIILHSVGMSHSSASSKSRKDLSYLRVHMCCYLNQQPDFKRECPNTGPACETISETIFAGSQLWHSSLSPAVITGRGAYLPP